MTIFASGKKLKEGLSLCASVLFFFLAQATIEGSFLNSLLSFLVNEEALSQLVKKLSKSALVICHVHNS